MGHVWRFVRGDFPQYDAERQWWAMRGNNGVGNYNMLRFGLHSPFG